MGQHSHLYGSRWRKARALFLTFNPLCRMCREAGSAVAASVVDHIKPHKGDEVLFWDEANWQALCETHHNATKQREEKRGHGIGCSADGTPLDAQHAWNRPRGRA